MAASLAASCTSIEFVGVPAVGKSAAAGALARSLDETGVQIIDGHTISLSAGILSLLRNPRHGSVATAVATATLRHTEGPLRSRISRAAALARGIARASLGHRLATRPPHRRALLDEGPITWILACRWDDEAARNEALAAVASFYREIGRHLVVLTAERDLLEHRRNSRRNSTRRSQQSGGDAAGARMRRRREAGAHRASWNERYRGFPDAAAHVLTSGAPGVVITVEPSATPDDIAAAARKAVGL